MSYSTVAIISSFIRVVFISFVMLLLQCGTDFWTGRRLRSPYTGRWRVQVARPGCHGDVESVRRRWEKTAAFWTALFAHLSVTTQPSQEPSRSFDVTGSRGLLPAHTSSHERLWSMHFNEIRVPVPVCHTLCMCTTFSLTVAQPMDKGPHQNVVKIWSIIVCNMPHVDVYCASLHMKRVKADAEQQSCLL